MLEPDRWLRQPVWVLDSGPFDLAEARRHGVTRAMLLDSKWRRLGPGVYARRENADDPIVRLKAARLCLPNDAVFSGRTAAFLHGLIPQLDVIEAIVRPPTSHLVGIKIRRCRLSSPEVVIRRGFSVTSASRTVIDLARGIPLVEALVIADTALHKGLMHLDQLPANLAELAEPATESPMETRLRMKLVTGGLPRPEVQVYLPDAHARADLYYPAQRVVIEYDGATHRDSLAADNRRQKRLIGAGYKILRFTASDFASGDVVGTVRRALTA